MNRSFRNLIALCALAAASSGLSAGCSGNTAGSPIGTSGTFTQGTSGTFTAGGTSAGTSSAAGTPSSSGSFGTAGTFTMGGTFSMTGGGNATAGGGDTGGTGGAAAGTSGSGGVAQGGMASGGAASDFPANCAMPTGQHSANALTKTCWKASATDCSDSGSIPSLKNPPSQAVDADQATRFSTGAHVTTSQIFKIDIDMGKAVMINGVAITADMSDYPPQVEVDVSTDGTTFTPVACTTSSTVTDISFAATNARYVRLISHGIADQVWWSIKDIAVYRSGDADTCGAGDTTTACTSIGMGATCCGATHTTN